MSLRLHEAIRQANEAYQENGRRYYVMPLNNSDGQLLVMDRPNFRKLKQKGYIDSKVRINDLVRECFYCTPYSNGIGTLDDDIVKLKRKQYYSWVESL